MLKSLQRRSLMLPLIFAASLSLTACQMTGSAVTEPVAVPKAIPCSSTGPIYWSKNDTRGTQEQAVTHNKVFKDVCTGEPQK